MLNNQKLANLEQEMLKIASNPKKAFSKANLVKFHVDEISCETAKAYIWVVNDVFTTLVPLFCGADTKLLFDKYCGNHRWFYIKNMMIHEIERPFAERMLAIEPCNIDVISSKNELINAVKGVLEHTHFLTEYILSGMSDMNEVEHWPFWMDRFQYKNSLMYNWLGKAIARYEVFIEQEAKIKPNKLLEAIATKPQLVKKAAVGNLIFIQNPLVPKAFITPKKLVSDIEDSIQGCGLYYELWEAERAKQLEFSGLQMSKQDKALLFDAAGYNPDDYLSILADGADCMEEIIHDMA